MKSKSISLFLLTIILSLVVVSAASLSLTSTTPAELTKTNTQTSLTITNKGPDAINLQVVLPTSINDGLGHDVLISSSSTLSYTNLTTNQNTGAINIIYSGDTTNFKIGEFSSNILINAQQVGNSSNTLTQTVPLKFLNSFCKSGENTTDLLISNINIDNNDGDDYEWKPLDEINIKVKAENSGTNRITDVYVELGLIDSDGKNVIKDMDNLNDKRIDLGSISEDKEKTADFTFKVPVDFNDGDYILVVKAYKSGKEAELCTSSSSDLDSKYYQTISGVRESDSGKQVVVDNIKVSPETPQCGDKVQITADVVNIGDEDYQDQFKVTLFNKELGLNLEQVIKEDLDQGDSYNVDFEFDVPQDSTEKTYTLEFKTYYDYDDSDETYNEVSDTAFTQSLKVQGNCQAVTPTGTSQVRITAKLDPETPQAIAGKQIIIQTTLTNIGNSDTTYTLSVYGNSAWSSLVSVEPQVLTLAPGTSKDVNIILSIDSAAVGDKDFTIRASYGAANEKSTEQKVALTVTKSSGSTEYDAITSHLKRNWFIYLIIIVNIILIIAIIAVVRRMTSPRKEYE